MMTLDQRGLQQLIDVAGVVGIGSWKKIKTFRLNPEMMAAVVAQREKERVEGGPTETPGSVNARTNIGAYRQHLDSGVCWALHLARVGA